MTLPHAIHLPALVAITGGIGSGKSSATSMFAAAGVATLDLDIVGHDVLPQLQAQLQRAFGDDILCQDGSINRLLLAQRSFATTDKTRLLGNIIHPLIWKKVFAWQQQQAAQAKKRCWILIEASTIIESSNKKRVNYVDYLLVVMADLAIRRQRVLQRGHPRKTLFNSIIKRQCDDTKRRNMADYIINNIDNMAVMYQQVQQCITLLDTRFNAL